MKKVLLINGSPHEKGNTYFALNEAARTLSENGFKTEIVWIGIKPVRGCIACGSCKKTGVNDGDKCVLHRIRAVSRHCVHGCIHTLTQQPLYKKISPERRLLQVKEQLTVVLEFR